MLYNASVVRERYPALTLPMLTSRCELNNTQHSTFAQIGEIGQGIIDICELGLSPVLEMTKALAAVEGTSATIGDMKQLYWSAVDMLKVRYSYAHFLLDSEWVCTFGVSGLLADEQTGYAGFIFQYYSSIHTRYREALELCLSVVVLEDYNLPERCLNFCNRNPDLANTMLRAVDGIAPIRKGVFDTTQVIRFDDPSEVDAQKVSRDIRADSEYAVSLQQYFAVQFGGDALLGRSLPARIPAGI